MRSWFELSLNVRSLSQAPEWLGSKACFIVLISSKMMREIGCELCWPNRCFRIYRSVGRDCYGSPSFAFAYAYMCSGKGHIRAIYDVGGGKQASDFADFANFAKRSLPDEDIHFVEIKHAFRVRAVTPTSASNGTWRCRVK